MNYTKVINVDLYKLKLYFYIVPDIKKKVEQIQKKLKETEDEWTVVTDSSEGGLYFPLGTSRHFIILSDNCLSHYYLSHEIQHFIDEVTEQRGAEEMPRAYLNGYITEEIHKFLNSKKIKLTPWNGWKDMAATKS